MTFLQIHSPSYVKDIASRPARWSEMKFHLCQAITLSKWHSI